MKEFFSRQLFINGLVFSIPVSFFVLMRMSYIEDFKFFSLESGQVYLILVLIFHVLFLLFLFILYLLGGRR